MQLNEKNSKVRVRVDRDKLAADMRARMIGGFRKDYSQVKDWYSRFIGVYWLARAVAWVCLAWSTVASYKFFEGNISWFEEPAGNQIMAAMLTGAQSFVIGFLTKRVLRDLFTGMWDFITSVLGVLVAALIVWNAATDWIGVPELARGLTPAPADTRTGMTDAAYTRQLDEAKAALGEAKQRKAYIAGPCKSEDCYVDGGKAYWQGKLTEYGKKAIRAADAEIREREAAVARVTQAWQQSRDKDQAQHARDLDEYETKVRRKTQGLQGLTAALLVFYILAELFQVYFGARAALDADDPPPAAYEPHDAPKRGAYGHSEGSDRIEQHLRGVSERLRENGYTVPGTGGGRGLS